VLTLAGVEASHTQGGAGEGGILGKGSGGEAKGLGAGRVSVCMRRDRGTVDVKVDTQCTGLVEDVADLRFVLGLAWECKVKTSRRKWNWS
jgi:hypothetical protein